MSHTKEPWATHEGDDDVIVATSDPHVSLLSVKDGTFGCFWNADDARRVVACVNACAGMTNPIADIAALKEAVEVQGLQLEMAAAAERVSVRRFQKINNLQPQAEALRRIASLFDLPAGTDVTVETLNCVKALKQQRDELLAAFNAACAFIDSHVADPDITDDMANNYEKFQAARASVKGGST